jgi:hypothetical protein
MQYKPGRVNQVADAVSRMDTKGTDQSVLDHEIPFLSIEVSPVVR